MASDLDFSVQLRLLNENFNAGINQARDKFTEYAQSVERNVSQMVSDTERADKMLTDLGNVDASRLTSELKATADQLRQMGAGANLSGDQIEAAMRTAAQQVGRLDQELVNARLEATRLGQTDASPEQIEQATAKVARLEQELNEAKSASTSLAGELAGAMNRASTTADGARNAIYRMANVRVPETIRGEIDQISRSLTNFQNNSGRPAAEIERVTRSAQEQIRRLEQELRGVDDQVQRTETGTKKLSGGVNNLKGAFGSLQGILAAAGLGIGVAEIIQAADAFVLLEARIKIATGEGVNFITGFEGVKQIANETFSSIANTGELFARITQASTTLGLAQGEILSVTKTINEAIKLSGGTAASADAAIIQLVQGLQSGVLRGEEFNSIMEQSPRLAQAMADGLGVTRGELRKMAGEGKLTSEVVIDSVRSQTKVIEDEFATLPVTFGNSIQLLKNTMFEFVGSLNETVNQSGRMAAAVQYISDSIKDIDPSTIAAVENHFDSLLVTLGDTFSAVKDIYSAISDMTSALAGGNEEVGLFTRLLGIASVSLGIMSDGFKGISILANSVFGTISQITGGILEGFSALKGQTSQRAAELYQLADELHKKSEQQMMDFESSSSKAWTAMNKTAQEKSDETVAKLVAGYDEMEAKGSYTAEALEEQFIKIAAAKIAQNDNMISDDMRLELAQRELQATFSETGELIIASAGGVQAAYLGVGESFAEVATKAQETGVSVTDSLTDLVPKAQTIGAVDDIINSLTAMSATGKITGQELAAGINLANERYKEIENNFARYAAKSIADNGGIVTSELEKAAALQGLAVQADETGSVLVTQLDRSTLASSRTKEQIDELAGAVGIGLSKEFVKSSASLDELISGFDDLTDAGYDAGGALVDSLTAMSDKASNTVEIEALIVKWNELYKEGKITGQELAEGLEGVQNRADILKDGINGVTEAYGLLGLKTREELAKDAGAYTDAYNIVKKDGQATAQQLEESFEKTAKANIASNNGVVDAVTKRMAAERGVTVAVDEQGRVTFEKMGQAKAANDNVTRSVNNIRTAYDGISSSAGSAGNSMVRAANDASSAYDKLQAKIKAVKEAQELKNADETLRNLRQYGTEDAPIEGNQFGTRLGVENFLKSQGLSEESAIEEARKLYAKQGTSSGALNFGELQGFSDGQMLTAADINRYKSASVYLAEIAEKARQVDRQRDNYEVARTATAQITTQEYNRYDSQPSSSKTINVNFKLGGATASMSMPESQEASLTALLQQLQDSKAIAGY
ncbi:tape measure protein [uncultured Psychrobacter sp.]|uniref:tape measure protein n=1 Tax=uncultured Psychrobacter sp. TaxID=259303 RepID=UPI0030DAD2BB|tara:strand:+ start:5659 stop:9474 length:3816 start_codon:yes stop_codon:yes gene_type:complete